VGVCDSVTRGWQVANVREGWSNEICVGLDQKNWGLTLLQHDSHRTYRGNKRNHFGVIEDVKCVGISGGKTLHQSRRVGRQCLTGCEWRWGAVVTAPLALPQEFC